MYVGPGSIFCKRAAKKHYLCHREKKCFHRVMFAAMCVNNFYGVIFAARCVDIFYRFIWKHTQVTKILIEMYVFQQICMEKLK